MTALLLSTIGKDAAKLAREHGLGIEIADFSYAVNMDEDFAYWNAVTTENLCDITNRAFHAPYSELCPAAVDPLALEVTSKRLRQALTLSRSYDIGRMVVHSGYIPKIYVKSWFTDRSVSFWRDFLTVVPQDFALLLENTFEESPDMLLDIVEAVGDARFQICLDVGHAAVAGHAVSVVNWIEAVSPYLSHAHIHNNNLAEDLHAPPGDGSINMRAAIDRILELRPNTTLTAETQDLHSALSWFKVCGY